jgi:Tfp pilus assembly protein PilE
MFKALSTKLFIIAIVAVLASLAYLRYEAHVAAVAAAAMEKRQADADLERKKFNEDFRKAARDQSVTWGNASQSIQNFKLDTPAHPAAKGKQK